MRPLGRVGWNQVIFTVPSNPNHSMFLCQSNTFQCTECSAQHLLLQLCELNNPQSSWQTWESWSPAYCTARVSDQRVIHERFLSGPSNDTLLNQTHFQRGITNLKFLPRRSLIKTWRYYSEYLLGLYQKLFYQMLTQCWGQQYLAVSLQPLRVHDVLISSKREC